MIIQETLWFILREHKCIFVLVSNGVDKNLGFRSDFVSVILSNFKKLLRILTSRLIFL
jgi:hypothetical protein